MKFIAGTGTILPCHRGNNSFKKTYNFKIKSIAHGIFDLYIYITIVLFRYLKKSLKIPSGYQES